jgi:uncharacterized protein DUF4332
MGTGRSIALVAAVGVLVTAVILARLEVPPVPTWFYVCAWYPTLVILDALVARLGGVSLLARPRELAAMLWWSAVIWFLFEALNFRLKDWYYVFLPDGRAERWLGISISLATVVPAVLLPARLLERYGVGGTLLRRPVGVRPRDLRLALALGCAMLGLTLVFPSLFHPLTWGAVWLIAEPLLYQSDPERSLFGDLARGEWGRIVRLMAAGLIAGALWETFNHLARGKWIYTVPFLEGVKLFEMPPLGFLGFPFFALEVWSLYHVLAPRTRPATLAPSVAFAVLVLVGMDHWTVSSTTPRVAELPLMTAEARGRLERAGLTDAFRLARLSSDEIGRRAGLEPDEAASVREAARLSTLRGIGTRHAAALMAGGIRTVADLAAASPEAVWSTARRGPRPTLPEVRVWVRAARLLLQERLEACPEVGRGAAHRIDVRAEPQAVLEGQPVELIELLFREGECRGAARGEKPQHLGRALLELRIGEHPRHEAELRRFGGREQTAGRGEVERHLLPHGAPQQRHHERWHKPTLHLGIPERRGCRREHEIAPRREAAPARERAPVHDRDYGLGQLAHLKENPRELQRGPAVFLDALVHRGEELVQVHPRAEVAAGAAQRHDAHAGVQVRPLQAR